MTWLGLAWQMALQVQVFVPNKSVDDCSTSSVHSVSTLFKLLYVHNWPCSAVDGAVVICDNPVIFHLLLVDCFDW